MKLFFILLIPLILFSKTFFIEGKVKYSKTDILFVNYKNLSINDKYILRNELNMCENIILSETPKNSFWELYFDKSLNKFFLKDRIKKETRAFSFSNFSSNIQKIHSVSSLISKKFKCDNSWLSKKLITVVQDKIKQTKLIISDISGETSKTLYNNKSLLLFPKKLQNFLYFTSIINNKAYLLEYNLNSGKITKLLSNDNGYLIVSDIKLIHNKVNILYTTITNNGQIQINKYTKGDFKPDTLSLIYKELLFSKIILSPKFSNKENAIYFTAESRNGTFSIYKFNINKRKLVRYIPGLKILTFDLNKNDDIVYKNIYNGTNQFFFFNSLNNKVYRLNTFKGNISKPLFVKEKGFIFTKENSKKLMNIFYYDIKNQRTIKVNKKYQYFNDFTL